MSEKKEPDEVKKAEKNSKVIGVFLALLPAVIGVAYMLINNPDGGGSLGRMMEWVVVAMVGYGLIGVSVIIFIIWGIVAAVSKAKSNNAERQDRE